MGIGLDLKDAAEQKMKKPIVTISSSVLDTPFVITGELGYVSSGHPIGVLRMDIGNFIATGTANEIVAKDYHVTITNHDGSGDTVVFLGRLNYVAENTAIFSTFAHGLMDFVAKTIQLVNQKDAIQQESGASTRTWAKDEPVCGGHIPVCLTARITYPSGEYAVFTLSDSDDLMVTKSHNGPVYLDDKGKIESCVQHSDGSDYSFSTEGNYKSVESMWKLIKVLGSDGISHPDESCCGSPETCEQMTCEGECEGESESVCEVDKQNCPKKHDEFEFENYYTDHGKVDVSQRVADALGAFLNSTEPLIEDIKSFVGQSLDFDVVHNFVSVFDYAKQVYNSLPEGDL